MGRGARFLWRNCTSASDQEGIIRIAIIAGVTGSAQYEGMKVLLECSFRAQGIIHPLRLRRRRTKVEERQVAIFQSSTHAAPPVCYLSRSEIMKISYKLDTKGNRLIQFYWYCCWAALGLFFTSPRLREDVFITHRGHHNRMCLQQ